MTSAPLTIRLLGEFAIAVGDEHIPAGAWRLRKGRSLVKILALAPEHRAHREQVVELLWPDRDPEAALNNLNQTLFTARRAFEAAGGDGTELLQLADEIVTLSPHAPPTIDVELFEAGVTRARAEPTPAAYEAAIGLYAGDLLPEDRYEDWAAPRQETLRETLLSLHTELAELHETAGDRTAAIEVLQRAVEIEPLHEPAHRELMRAYERDGQRQRALAQYQRLRRALRGAYADEPDPETRTLYQEMLRAGHPGDAEPTDAQEIVAPGSKAARARPAAPTNLQPALSTFIGREEELGAIARLLERSRLVTLTGAGGSGKTRLAQEVASRLLPEYPDGVWLVELAALGDEALVAPAVASTFSVPLSGERSAAEAIAAWIGDRRMLVVLDNCERLVGACARLALELLCVCPDLVVITTSREPLQARGEQLFRVPPLALPDPTSRPDLESLLSYESVQLFRERAGEISPGFAIGADNVEAIAEVCIRVDGMPLAIELAAARVNVLEPAQIAKRLGESIDLLSAGGRTAPSRQQTLRATFAWSQDLLTDEEQVVFRRLGVFAGSLEIEGAEAVCAGEGIEPSRVLELLAHLADKSLLFVERSGAAARYRLLETGRQFARERLAEAGELEAVEARHRAYYRRVAAVNDPDAGQLDVPAAMARLEAEHDNCRAALDSALLSDPEAALDLATHLARFWLDRSHLVEGRRWLEMALARAPERSVSRARALLSLVSLAYRAGGTAEASRLADECAGEAAALGEGHTRAMALQIGAAIEQARSTFDRAEARLEEVLDFAGALGDPLVAGSATHLMGIFAGLRGDHERAGKLIRRALALLDDAGDELEPSFLVANCGLPSLDDGKGGRRVLFEETFYTFRRVGAELARGYALINLGTVRRVADDPPAAQVSYEEGLAEFRELGDDAGTALALGQLGNLARATTDYALGRDCFEESIELRRALGDERAAQVTKGAFGLLEARAGTLDLGRELVGQAIDHFEATGDRVGLALELGNLASIELDAGEHGLATEHLLRARELLRRWGEPRLLAWVEVALAEAKLGSGRTEEALAHLASAADAFERIGDRCGTEHCARMKARLAASGVPAAKVDDG